MNDHAAIDPLPTTPKDPAAHRRALLAGVAGLAAGALLTNRAAAGPLDPPAGPSPAPASPSPRSNPGSSNPNANYTF